MSRSKSAVSACIYLINILAHSVSALPADKFERFQSGQLPATTAECTDPLGSSVTCGNFIGQTSTTVVATTNGKSTWNETYIATSFPAYSTLTKPTTITTTGTAGETIAAVILAGGAALLAVPKPIIPEAPITSIPTPSLPSSKSTTSATSTASRTAQPEMITLPVSNWMKVFGTPHVLYSSNDIACGSSEDTPAVGRDTISSKIKEFCDSKNGTVVNQKTITQETYNVGAGVALNITVNQYPLCATRNAIESTIFSEDCSYFLHEALDGCDTDTLSKRGGKVSDTCFIWNLQPEYNAGDLTCGTTLKDGTGVNRDEALENIKDFCSSFAESPLDPSKKVDKTYKPRVGNSNMILSAQYSDDAECKKEASTPYTVDRAACERFLRRTIDDCDVGFKGSMGKYGGSIQDGCGVFILKTEIEEMIQCGHNAYPRAKDLTPDATKAAIDSYCGRSLTLDPNYKSDNQFHQDTPSGESYDNVVSGDVVVRIRTQFNSQNQKDCAPSRSFDTQGDECRRRMEVIQGKCGKDGGVLSSNTQDGCVLWTMWGTSSS